MFRIVLACDGVPKDVGAQAAVDIAEEFTHRPWHINVQSRWDGARLILQAENDVDADGEALSDEFSDAISASIAAPFDGAISKVSVVKLDDMTPNTSLERTRDR
jgi:hypothetical protein